MTLPALRNLGVRGLRRGDLSQPRVGTEPVECAATECESRELIRNWVHEKFSRNLLSRRQLAQPWADSRPITYGSGIPKPHSSRQRSPSKIYLHPPVRDVIADLTKPRSALYLEGAKP